MDKLLPYVADESNDMEVTANAALALGFVFVGSGNHEISETILQTMMERDPSQLTDKWAKFMGLALGLVYLGRSFLNQSIS
jgi:26S proteasome regulatory subunit N1